MAARAQGKVEHQQDVALHFAVEVDQQVAADNEVNLRKGWVRQQVVARKQHFFAHFLAHPVMLVFLDEELAQPAGRHIGHDRFGVQAGTGDADGTLIEVGGKHLDLAVALLQRKLLTDQHGQAVGLFAGGAAGRPDADLVMAVDGVMLAGQLRQHVPLQGLEGFAVAEEVGHTDQHVCQQRRGLGGVLLEVVQVAGEVALPGHVQAAFNAPQHGGALVVLEIVPRVAAQLQEDLLQQRLAGLGVAYAGAQRRGQGVILDFRQPDLAGVTPQLQQLLWHLGHGQHQVDHAGFDGSPGHAVVLGIVRGLNQGHAALLLDPRQPHGTVGAGARQHHAECMVLVHVGQVAEEQVNGHVVATAAIGGGHAQVAVIGREAIGRGDDIHMVTLDRHRLGDLAHGHLRGGLDDPVGYALMIRRQVQHHHERHAAVAWHMPEQRADGLQATRGGTDAHHRKVQVAWAECRVLRRGGLLGRGLHRRSLVQEPYGRCVTVQSHLNSGAIIGRYPAVVTAACAIKCDPPANGAQIVGLHVFRATGQLPSKRVSQAGNCRFGI